MQSRERSEASAQTQAQVLQNSFMEYCSTTTIHGIPYLTERRRHWTERCWWTIAIVLSVWFCSSSIRNVWIKWRDHPVTMTLTEEQLPISAVPFPTVTICPITKARRSKFDLNQSRQYPHNSSEIKSNQWESMSHICIPAYFPLKRNGDLQQFVNASIIFNMIQDLAPPMNDTVQNCAWSQPFVGNKCSDILVPIITAEGLCFSFNQISPSDIYSNIMAPEMMKVVDRPNLTDWSLENGYKDVDDAMSYPFHVYSVGHNDPLSLFLQTLRDDIDGSAIYSCNSLVPGYRIFLHTPGEILKSSDLFIRVTFTEDVEISIKPKLITTENELRSYKPSQRKCYFNSERRLQFFKFYSEENCKAECVANYTLQECGCVKFYMPRNVTTKICGSGNFLCYRNAYHNLMEINNIPKGVSADAKLFRQSCDCLPSCTSITYETTIDRAVVKYYDDLPKFHQSKVMIYFQSYEITTMRRQEQYTNTDFLAICGGILGLCLGVSALSIIEFIYWSTLRLFWSLRTRKSENNVIPVKPVVKPQNVNHISIDMPHE